MGHALALGASLTTLGYGGERLASNSVFDALVDQHDAAWMRRDVHDCTTARALLCGAARRVRAGGALIVEGFDHHRMNNRSANWYFDVLAMLDDADALIADVRHRQPECPTTQVGAMQAWRALHGTACSVRDHLEDLGDDSFEVVQIERGIGFATTLAHRLPHTTRAVRALNGLVAMEQAWVAAGHIAATGWRVVARRT